MPSQTQTATSIEMKLEVVPIPVSDVDAAKAFYTEKVGFHLDHDVRPGNGMRVVQMTPPRLGLLGCDRRGSAARQTRLGQGCPAGGPGHRCRAGGARRARRPSRRCPTARARGICGLALHLL